MALSAAVAHPGRLPAAPVVSVTRRHWSIQGVTWGADTVPVARGFCTSRWAVADTDLTLSGAALLSAGVWLALWLSANRARRRLDPGRATLAVEYLRNGKTILTLPLASGGSLSVSRHAASERSTPPGARSETASQEWRVLRFQPEEGESDLVQSVAKVGIEPAVKAGETRIWQLGHVLPLAYTKSFVSVVLASLHILGAPVLQQPSSGKEGPARPSGDGLRFLCIGLGGGTMASFLAAALPQCSVDVVELEPCVARAATEAMGFQSDERLRLTVADGAEFAQEAVSGGQDVEVGVYDAVLVDAYTADGAVPEALCESTGGLARALKKGLFPRRRGGVVAANLLPHIGAGTALWTYGEALEPRPGLGFSIRELDTSRLGNFIAVHMCGDAAEGLRHADLRVRLKTAAEEVAAALDCPFDMAELAVRGYSGAVSV